MSQFENSEIMMEYANIMGYSSPIIKEAWDWTDMVNALGLDALVGAGLGAGGAAIAGGTAAQIAGGAAAGALPFAGIGGAAAAGGAAAIWPITLAVLAAGGVAYTIWQVTKVTDDNINDLIERLDALDVEGTNAEKVVADWKRTLESFKPYFEVEMAPDPGNPGAVAKQAQQRLQGLETISAYLKRMTATWSQVKPLLKDWGRDPQQFEVALQKTTASVDQQLAAIKTQAQQAAKEMIAQKGQTQGVDLSNIAGDIVALEAKIEQLGEKPIYEKNDIDERSARNLVNRVLNETVTEDEVNQYGTSMVALRDRMRNSLQRMEARQSRKPGKNRPASFKPYISKRAFRTSSEPPTTRTPGEQGGAPRPVKNPKVQLLQRLINRLNIALNSGIDRIEEDGSYGVDTAAAFTGLVSKFKRLEIALRLQAGLDEKSLVDFKVMSNPDYLDDALKVLYEYLQKVTGGNAVPDARRQEQGQDPTQGVQCNPNKANPSPEEVSACLRGILMRDPASGREVSIYMFLQGKGMTEHGMREYIYRKYRARAPRDWSWPDIADDFKGARYSFP